MAWYPVPMRFEKIMDNLKDLERIPKMRRGCLILPEFLALPEYWIEKKMSFAQWQ